MTCPKCLQELDDNHFSRAQNGNVSREYWCKSCRSVYMKNWYNKPKNKQKRREAQRKRYEQKKLEISNKAATYYQKHREKIRERDRLWKLNNPEEHHNKILKKFKITSDEYLNLFKRQQGKCAICGADSYGKKGAKRFAVDHCHKTGKNRGLLCMNCNALLGHAKDDIARLYSAIKYLEDNNVNI